MHAEGVANDEKVIPMVEEKHMDVSRAVAAEDSSGRVDVSTSKKGKLNRARQQNPNLKPRSTTIPRPFSLETEQRMSRSGRRAAASSAPTNYQERVTGSMEVKKPRPGSSSKSVNLNHK